MSAIAWRDGCEAEVLGGGVLGRGRREGAERRAEGGSWEEDRGRELGGRRREGVALARVSCWVWLRDKTD